MLDVVNILGEISTGDVIYDDEYRGYLYEIRDKFAINPYVMFMINVMTTNRHVSTDKMRTLVVKEKKPYLYFSRNYPDLMILQYILLKELKDIKLNKRLTAVIDSHVSETTGIYYFTYGTVLAAYIMAQVAKMLCNVNIYNYLEHDTVHKLLVRYLNQDIILWNAIIDAVSMSTYDEDDKNKIDKIFNIEIFKT